MAVDGRPLQAMAGHGRAWQAMAGHGSLWPAMAAMANKMVFVEAVLQYFQTTKQTRNCHTGVCETKMPLLLKKVGKKRSENAGKVGSKTNVCTVFVLAEISQSVSEPGFSAQRGLKIVQNGSKRVFPELGKKSPIIGPLMAFKRAPCCVAVVA